MCARYSVSSLDEAFTTLSFPYPHSQTPRICWSILIAVAVCVQGSLAVSTSFRNCQLVLTLHILSHSASLGFSLGHRCVGAHQSFFLFIFPCLHVYIFVCCLVIDLSFTIFSVVLLSVIFF